MASAAGGSAVEALLAELFAVLLAVLPVVLLAELGVALLAALGVVLLSGGLDDLESEFAVLLLADPLLADPLLADPLFTVPLFVDGGFAGPDRAGPEPVEFVDVDLVVCEFDCVDFGSGFFVTLAGGSWPSIAATVGKFHPNQAFKRGCRRKYTRAIAMMATTHFAGSTRSTLAIVSVSLLERRTIRANTFGFSFARRRKPA